MPALWYSAFATAVMWVCLCLNSIVRRRWEDEERLPFPLTVLPLQLSDENPSLFRNRLWWIGVGVAMTVGLWNALAGLVPSLPVLPLGIDYSSYVPATSPGTRCASSRFEWQPFTVGLCYLLPLDLALSLWVFGLLWQAEYVISNLFAWNTGGYYGFPYCDQQSGGAYFALLVSAFWLDRRYLGQVVRKVLGMPSHLREEGEALSYRGAVLGCFPHCSS